MAETVKDEHLLKLYGGFAEFIIQKTGIKERDHTDAIVLRQEINTCIKKGIPLSSYWRLLAYRLFESNHIKDERITKENILEKVEFEYEGESYTTDVRYIDFDLVKFPEKSILTQNQERENERDYIIRILKRSMSKYKHCDPTKVYVFQDYVLVFADNDQ